MKRLVHDKKKHVGSKPPPPRPLLMNKKYGTISTIIRNGDKIMAEFKDNGLIDDHQRFQGEANPELQKALCLLTECFQRRSRNATAVCFMSYIMLFFTSYTRI